MAARKRQEWMSYLTEEERANLIFLERREREGIEAKIKQTPIIDAAKARHRAAVSKYELKDLGRSRESQASGT
jgi:hypothetical protein